MLEGVRHGDEERLFERGVQADMFVVESIGAPSQQGEGAAGLIFDDQWQAQRRAQRLAQRLQQVQGHRLFLGLVDREHRRELASLVHLCQRFHHSFGFVREGDDHVHPLALFDIRPSDDSHGVNIRLVLLEIQDIRRDVAGEELDAGMEPFLDVEVAAEPEGGLAKKLIFVDHLSSSSQLLLLTILPTVVEYNNRNYELSQIRKLRLP